MFFPLMFHTCYRIVEERQTRNKHLMKQMGMHVFPYWLSWWCSYFLINLVVAVICGFTSGLGIFQQASDSVMIATLILSGQAYFGLVWICSVVFDSPQNACIMLTLLIWALNTCDLAVDIPGSWTPATHTKALMCLLNPMLTIKQLWRLIIAYDNNGLAVNFQNGWNIVR